MSTNLLDKYYADTEKFYFSLNKKRAEAILEECNEVLEAKNSEERIEELIPKHITNKQINL